MRQTKVTERTQMTGQSIDYQSLEVWGASGKCHMCKHNRVHVHATKSPGPVTIDEAGIGQFSFIVTYEWSCAACNAGGPLSHIGNH